MTMLNSLLRMCPLLLLCALAHADPATLLVPAASSATTPAPAAPALPPPNADSDATITVDMLWAGVITGEAGKRSFENETDEVPARLGVEFGMVYLITGPAAGSTIRLEQLATYPAPGRRNAETRKMQREETGETECVVGEPCLTSYLIEARDEIIPGEWRLELRLNGKTVLSRKFTMRYQGI